MLIGVPRHIILQTIAKNLLRVGIIREDEIEYTKNVYAQCDDDELTRTLVESYMLNPINLEQHEIRYISDN